MHLSGHIHNHLRRWINRDWRYDLQDRLVARKDVYKFILYTLRPSSGLISTVSAVGLLIGLIVLLSSPLTGGIISSLSVISLLINLFMFHRDIFNRPHAEIRRHEDTTAVAESIQGGVRVPFRNHYVLKSENLDKALRKGQDFILEENPEAYRKILEFLKLKPETWETALRCELYQSIHSDPPERFENENKLCLASDLLEDDSNVMYYKGCYYVSFLTNELSTQRVVAPGAEPQPILDGVSELFPREQKQTGYELKSINDSCMGNHIGVSTLALTEDNNIVLWRQTKRAKKSQTLLAPTGSGSCDYVDLDASRSLQRTIKTSMKREFAEESSERGSGELPTYLKAKVSDTALLGYFRWVNRAGKPEFVGAAKVEVPANRLFPNVSEVERATFESEKLVRPCGSLEVMQKELKELLQRDDLSVPLWVNITCLEEALLEDPQRWDKFFFG